VIEKMASEKSLEEEVKDLKGKLMAEKKSVNSLRDSMINLTEYLRSKTRSKKNKQILDLIDCSIYSHY